MRAARVEWRLFVSMLANLIGALLAFFIAQMGGKYYLEIILPGSLVGLLTGYATIRFGRPPPLGISQSRST